MSPAEQTGKRPKLHVKRVFRRSACIPRNTVNVMAARSRPPTVIANLIEVATGASVYERVRYEEWYTAGSAWIVGRVSRSPDSFMFARTDTPALLRAFHVAV